MTIFSETAASNSLYPRYSQAWNDPAVEARIRDGIARHRMRRVQIEVVDAAGAPLPGARIEAAQVRHEFLFGANIFLLGNYPDAARNEKYEAVFRDLLNAATVPLYWRDLEPVEGPPRFGADSIPVYRRPPVDPVVEFGEKNGLVLNGHTLVWDQPELSIPDWLPPDPATRAAAIRRRIREIAARYGNRIPRWDVLNELAKRPVFADRVPMPEDFGMLAFREAQAALPADAVLMINEITEAWTEKRGRYLEIVRDLDERGARIDAVGVQFHLFTRDAVRSVLAGEQYTPGEFFDALDALASAGRPLHVSEITLPALSDSDEDRECQAAMARNFYRLWFSHPAVEWITWWNLVDGGGVPAKPGVPAENEVPSGILDRNLDPKPVYTALDALINHEWKTRAELVADSAGRAELHGFHGVYEVAVQHAGRISRHALTLAKSGADRPHRLQCAPEDLS